MSWNPDDRHVSERLGRFYSLTDLIKSAYDANDLPAAATLADEYLQLASVYRWNWNYGNAIHDANKYLGLIRLKDNDPAGAAAYLLKSGKSSGSPQLNSFGPELDLANALLQAGHVEPVKLYLRDIKSFWEMDNGRVDEWLASIDKGEKPILDRFPPKPGATQIALFWLALAWPALVVGGCLYLRRRRIANKWGFGLAGLAVGYLALFAAGWAIGYGLPVVSDALADFAWLLMPALYLSIVAGFLFPLFTVLGASRFFIAEKKLHP